MDVGAVKHPPSCANCGNPLAGRYCSSCGQRADGDVHSVGHFLHELLEAFTHADSRVWGTLLPLLRRSDGRLSGLPTPYTSLFRQLAAEAATPAQP